MFVISITFPSLLKHPEEFVGLLHGEAHPVVFDVIDIFVNGALGASINDWGVPGTGEFQGITQAVDPDPGAARPGQPGVKFGSAPFRLSLTMPDRYTGKCLGLKRQVEKNPLSLKGAPKRPS
jgi:hypothetical protein